VCFVPGISRAKRRLGLIQFQDGRRNFAMAKIKYEIKYEVKEKLYALKHALQKEEKENADKRA
jgi:hypothetical protein